MAQKYDKLISGLPGSGTPFAQYPDFINSMFTACMSDFSGTSAPSTPEIGMTYYNTAEKKQYRYLGQTEGWVESIAGDTTVSSLKTEVENARQGEVTLSDRIIKLASQNAGNTFPTGQKVWVGMPCYRKDLQAIYVCTFFDPNGTAHTWTDISDLMPGLNTLRNEVLNARGVTASLSARLDVALNHDGTLKGNAPAGEWWEPITPYTFTKVNTDKLEIADGDYTALFETDRAVLLHPSHNKAYVVSSEYDAESNKTIIIIDEEVGEDNQIQFGAPVGNGSKVKEASVGNAGVVEITDSVRASADIPPDEDKVPTEKAVSVALDKQKITLVQPVSDHNEDEQAHQGAIKAVKEAEAQGQIIQAANVNKATDLNTVVKQGKYYFPSGMAGANKPDFNEFILEVVQAENGKVKQFAYAMSSNKIKYRTQCNDNWSEWVSLGSLSFPSPRCISEYWIEIANVNHDYTYTPPCSGWLRVQGKTANAGEHIGIWGGITLTLWSYSAYSDIVGFIPVHEGITVTIYHSCTGTTTNNIGAVSEPGTLTVLFYPNEGEI